MILYYHHGDDKHEKEHFFEIIHFLQIFELALFHSNFKGPAEKKHVIK